MTAPQAVIRYSIVIPVYRNAEGIDELLDALTEIMAPYGDAIETVFVVDGSPDDSWSRLQAGVAARGMSAQLIAHARNFGAFAAIRTGLANARGDYIGVMAADLQEPPELMTQFFELLDSGEHDVVVGARTTRDDPALSSFASRSFWSMYRALVNRDFPVGGVDVFGCTRQVAEVLTSLDESHSSLVGLLYWAGFRRVEVSYGRRARATGTSAWTFRKKRAYLLDSIFSFTDLPIRLITWIGIVGVVASFAVAATVLVTWLLGGIPVPGYAATMLVLLASTATILIALGVVGTYVWRAFENTKRRPGAVVMSRETHDGRGDR